MSCSSSRVVALSILIASLAATASAQFHWVEASPGSASGYGVATGTASTSGFNATAMAATQAGEPIVFWVPNLVGGSCVYARVLRNGTWQATSPGSDTGTGLTNSAIKIEAIDAINAGDGTPYVFWEQMMSGSSAVNIFGKRFVNNTWQEINGSASGTGISGTDGAGTPPDVEAGLDSQGRPMVAWLGYGIVNVRGFDGTSFSRVPADATTPLATGSMMYGNAFTRTAGSPVLFWTSNNATHAKKWTGSAWENLPASAPNPQIFATSEKPAACLATDGNAIVASGNKARKFDGATWNDIGTTFPGSAKAIFYGPDEKLTVLTSGYNPSSYGYILRMFQYDQAQNAWLPLGEESSDQSGIGIQQASYDSAGVYCDTATKTIYVCWAYVSFAGPTMTGSIYCKKLSLTNAVADWQQFQ